MRFVPPISAPARKRGRAVLCALLLAAVAQAGFAQGSRAVREKKYIAPYVATPQEVVEKMLRAADVKPGEVVYDLGSGDGRVLVTAVQKFRARAVGIELSPKLVESSTEQIKKLGIDGDAKVIHGDVLDADLSEADVVVMYLLTLSNEMLRPRLEQQLKPGARVVSHDFRINGWEPIHVEDADAYKRKHRIYVYQWKGAKK